MLDGIVAVAVGFAVVLVVLVIVIVIAMLVVVCVLDTIEMLVYVQMGLVLIVTVIDAHVRPHYFEEPPLLHKRCPSILSERRAPRLHSIAERS